MPHAASLLPQPASPPHHLPGLHPSASAAWLRGWVCPWCVIRWIWPLIDHYHCSGSGMLIEPPVHCQVAWVGNAVAQRSLDAYWCFICPNALCSLDSTFPAVQSGTVFTHSQGPGKYKKSHWPSLKGIMNSLLFGNMISHELYLKCRG